MDHQVPVHSTVQPSTSPDDVRPVLAAMIGALRARRAAITRVLEALGESLVMLSLHKDMSRKDVRAVHKELGDHLATGSAVVLVNATNNAKTDRRALLDIAARHRASTLAVVCTSDPAETTLIASLPGEGWHAVVVAR